MMSMISMFVPYFMTVLCFMSSHSMFMFWILLEVCMTFFMLICLMEVNISTSFFNFGIFYFLVQSIGSLLILFSFLLDSFNFDTSGILLVFSIVLKMGLFPFFSWVISVCDYITSFSFLVLLIFQKIPLYLIMFNFSFFDCMDLILLSSFCFGSVFIFFCNTMKLVLASSSVTYSFWLKIIFEDSLFCFILFNLIYLLVLSFMMFLPVYNVGSSPLIFISVACSFLFFSGIPPMSMFFFKYNIIDFLVSKESVLFFITFWLFSFILLFGYMKLFYKYFIMLSNFFKVSFESFSNLIFFFFLSVGSLIYMG